MTKIAILGSGIVGDTLANGFLAKGHSVMRGSRDPGKLAAWKSSATGDASIGSFADAASWCEAAVLCVKGSAAEGLVGELAGALAGKLVLDTTNPISDAPPQNGVIQYFTKQNESLMERLQAKAPDAKLVKAFNCVGSVFMVDPKFASKPTMFICGNDDAAKVQATEILTSFGWETADMGRIEAARPIESLCVLWCVPGIAKGQWTHAFKLLRLG